MITIRGREIGEGNPCYIIAEISANHRQNIDTAAGLVRSAKAAGADAVKVQLYEPGTLTLPIDDPNSDFYLKDGLWAGTSLWNLYTHTYMPWSWYPDLLELADALDIALFPTVSDLRSLEYAEQFPTPAYKIASFEIGDRRLVKAVVDTGKPVFISDGCFNHSYDRYDDEYFVKSLPADRVFVLHCMSQYPAEPTRHDLRLAVSMGGLSDHTVGAEFPFACAYKGLSVLEKHLKPESGDCADSEFSLTPTQFEWMVRLVRAVEIARDCISQLPVSAEHTPSPYQRSIYTLQDIVAGDEFTPSNVGLVRPGYGMDARKFEQVLGRSASVDIPYGAALNTEHIK